MKVSVVIPAYKAARTICRAVDSVLNQTQPAHEIIVVDDGSPDDLADVVERTYGDRVILIRQPNGKTAKARNTGIERATGDFIAFLDADDYWEPNKLAVQLAVCEKHPDVGIVAGGFYEEEPGNMRKPYLPAETLQDSVDRVLRPAGARAFRLATIVWTGTVIIRREALGSERFVSGLEPAEDRDLWVRVIRSNALYLLAEPLATAVLESGSISRSNIDRDCSSMLRVVERNGDLLGHLASRLWRSHTLYRWAANDPQPSTALPHLVQSLWLWPLPYQGIPTIQRLGRVKRMLVLLAKAARLRA